MRTNRGLTVALSTVLALTGIVRHPGPYLAGSGAHPPSADDRQLPAFGQRQGGVMRSQHLAESATCVAVGDDGGNASSVLVTNNGGTTWTDTARAPGVTTLSTVSCPSASVCYAGGGSGDHEIHRWRVECGPVLDGTFPAESISFASRIDECHCCRRSWNRRDDGRPEFRLRSRLPANRKT